MDEPIQIRQIPLRLSNAYLIISDEISILIDAGMPGEAERIIGHLERYSISGLDWIFLTHAHLDHAGSAAEVRRLTGARLVIQAADANALREGKTYLGDVRGRGRLIAWLLPFFERFISVEPTEPDVVFDSGISFPGSSFQVKAFHTPGHTLGSASLIVQNTHLFAGDLVSTTGKPHAQRYYAQDWSALEASLTLIKSYRPMNTYPGHGTQSLELNDLLGLTL